MAIPNVEKSKPNDKSMMDIEMMDIDKIRTYRTQTPYTFFGHKAFTAISYPGDGAKSQPTGCAYLSFDFLSLQIFTTN
jgi:hypothetical protein